MNTIIVRFTSYHDLYSLVLSYPMFHKKSLFNLFVKWTSRWSEHAAPCLINAIQIEDVFKSRVSVSWGP